MQVSTSHASTRRLLMCAFGLLATLMAQAALAEHYAVGDKIESFTLKDQHGKSHNVDASVKVVLFSRDMGGGEFLKRGLADVAPKYLNVKKAVYVVDVSGMPAVIATDFAIPSMRDRPYSVLLDRDGKTTARLPNVKGKATLVFLDRLTVQRIVHVTEAKAIQRELGRMSDGE